MFRFKTFLQRHHAEVLLLVLILISSIMIAVSSKKIVFNAKEIGISIISPIQNFFSTIQSWITGSVASLQETKDLKIKYHDAVQKLEHYQNIEQQFVEAQNENARLKIQLDFSQNYIYKNIPAKIIAHDPENNYLTLIINKGSLHGIQRQMPVIAYQNGIQALVGKIEYVGLSYSHILPLYDSRCNISARLQQSRYTGIISGKDNEQYLRMSYVPKKAKNEISFGDLIVTSGISFVNTYDDKSKMETNASIQSIYPAEIYIGRVRSILSKDYESSLELQIEPIIQFTKLEYVFILKAENK